MSDQKNSRVDKFEKRRKNTKLITFLFFVGAFMFVLLIGIWIFGGDEEIASDSIAEKEEENEEGYFIEIEETDEENISTEDEAVISEIEEDSVDEAEKEMDKGQGQYENITTEETEPSDNNVKEAYSGNWPPVGTTQTGPHTTVYDDGSQDRIEIKEATSLVTGIPGEDMIEWRVENGGDQKVITTVSDRTVPDGDTYRVFLTWVDNEGWQPTKVEILIENDKR